MDDQTTPALDSPHPVHPAPAVRANGGSPVRAPRPTPREGEPAADESGTLPRRPYRRALVAILVLVALSGGIAYWLYARTYEDTDDAAVDGDIVAVSSRVVGSVTAVHVVDNQAVKKGEVLVELDPTDLEVAVARARAAVAQAQAEIASDQPTVAITRVTSRSAVQQARADLESARADVDASQRSLDEAGAKERLARSQLARAKELLAGQSMSQEDYDARATAYDIAVAAVLSAQRQLDGREARLRASESRLHEAEQTAPGQLASREALVEARRANLELAQAELHQAELNLSYAKVAAPADGIIGRKSVNPGERIQVGQELMALTRTSGLWVTANFRETQLRRMRLGQPAIVHVDALGKDFRGRVESFGGATGSMYSLLPPENASGNYVKVVQRIPVRIALEPGQSGLDRLRPGMSVEPKVSLR